MSYLKGQFNQKKYVSSLLQPIFTFLSRRRPPEAVVIITAAKEEVRKRSNVQKNEMDSWVKRAQDFHFADVCS